MANTLMEKILSFNLMKDYSTTPKNVVMVTVDDIIELFHELVPYTMSRLDEVEVREQLITKHQKDLLLRVRDEAVDLEKVTGTLQERRTTVRAVPVDSLNQIIESLEEK